MYTPSFDTKRSGTPIVSKTALDITAERMLQEGGDFSGAALMPNYLRLSQAERERLERENSK